MLSSVVPKFLLVCAVSVVSDPERMGCVTPCYYPVLKAEARLSGGSQGRTVCPWEGSSSFRTRTGLNHFKRCLYFST